MNKEKFVVEYELKSVSPALLWPYIGTKSGLADWFADDVESDGKQFTFFWNKTSQQAHQIAMRTGLYIRFHWLDDEEEKSYFELRITTSELTGATMLAVTDFAYPDEMADSRDLWDHQIETLRRKLGV